MALKPERMFSDINKVFQVYQNKRKKSRLVIDERPWHLSINDVSWFKYTYDNGRNKQISRGCSVCVKCGRYIARRILWLS